MMMTNNQLFSGVVTNQDLSAELSCLYSELEQFCDASLCLVILGPTGGQRYRCGGYMIAP